MRVLLGYGQAASNVLRNFQPVWLTSAALFRGQFCSRRCSKPSKSDSTAQESGCPLLDIRARSAGADESTLTHCSDSCWKSWHFCVAYSTLIGGVGYGWWVLASKVIFEKTWSSTMSNNHFMKAYFSAMIEVQIMPNMMRILGSSASGYRVLRTSVQSSAFRLGQSIMEQNPAQNMAAVES